MATYYVWAGASGASNGTSLADAWPSCAHITGITSGDTIYFYASGSTPEDVCYVDATLALTANSMGAVAHPLSPSRPVLSSNVRMANSVWTNIGSGVFTTTLGATDISQVLYNYGAAINADGLPYGFMRKASSAAALVASGSGGNGLWFYDTGTKLLTIAIPAAASGVGADQLAETLKYSYLTSDASARYTVEVTGSGLTVVGLEIRLGLNRGNAIGYGLRNVNASGAVFSDCRFIDCGNHGLVAYDVQGAVTITDCFAAGAWQASSGQGWIGFTNYTNAGSVTAPIRVTNCRALCSMTIGPDGSTMVFKDTTEASAGTIVDGPGGFYAHSGNAAYVWSDIEYRGCVAEGWGAVKMIDGGFPCGNVSATEVSDRLSAASYPVRCYDCRTINGNDLDLGNNQAYVRHRFDLPRCKSFAATVMTAFNYQTAPGSGSFPSTGVALRINYTNNADAARHTLLEACEVFVDVTGTTFAGSTGAVTAFGVHIWNGAASNKSRLTMRGCSTYMLKGAGTHNANHGFFGAQAVSHAGGSVATSPTPVIDCEQCVFSTDDTAMAFLLCDYVTSSIQGSNYWRFHNCWNHNIATNKYVVGTQSSPGNYYTSLDSEAEWKVQTWTDGDGSSHLGTGVYGIDPQFANVSNRDLTPAAGGALRLARSSEVYQQGPSGVVGINGAPYGGRFGAWQDGSALRRRGQSKRGILRQSA